jgi:hypothetical protein
MGQPLPSQLAQISCKQAEYMTQNKKIHYSPSLPIFAELTQIRQTNAGYSPGFHTQGTTP